MQNRKPSSRSAARLSVSSGPMARSCALPQFQQERRRERPVGVHELQNFRELPSDRSASMRRLLQNRPISRFLSWQAAHHLHAAEQQKLVDLRHQPPASAARGNSRAQHGAIRGAEPRERLVVADLALRQRDDRLQIEIDAAGIDRVADGARSFRRGCRVAAGRRAWALLVAGRRRCAARSSRAGREVLGAGELQLMQATVSASCFTRVPSSASSPVIASSRRGPFRRRRR
jgi:hypothetical protein